MRCLYTFFDKRHFFKKNNNFFVKSYLAVVVGKLFFCKIFYFLAWKQKVNKLVLSRNTLQYISGRSIVFDIPIGTLIVFFTHNMILTISILQAGCMVSSKTTSVDENEPFFGNLIFTSQTWRLAEMRGQKGQLHTIACWFYQQYISHLSVFETQIFTNIIFCPKVIYLFVKFFVKKM